MALFDVLGFVVVMLIIVEVAMVVLLDFLIIVAEIDGIGFENQCFVTGVKVFIIGKAYLIIFLFHLNLPKHEGLIVDFFRSL